MKRLPVLLFFAGSFAYPQDQPGPVTAEKITFQNRLQWYATTTYTDPHRFAWLVGEVTANDFLFSGMAIGALAYQVGASPWLRFMAKEWSPTPRSYSSAN